MYYQTRLFLISNIFIIFFTISVVSANEYSRVLSPPMTIKINGESMQLTGGLNRPEPQLLIGIMMEFWIVLLMIEMESYSIGKGCPIGSLVIGLCLQ